MVAQQTGESPSSSMGASRVFPPNRAANGGSREVETRRKQSEVEPLGTNKDFEASGATWSFQSILWKATRTGMQNFGRLGEKATPTHCTRSLAERRGQLHIGETRGRNGVLRTCPGV